MTQSADALNRFIEHSEQLLEVAELLARENAQLKTKLAQSQAQAASLEKRLSGARARIEALIARLPENETQTLLPGNP